MEIFIDMDGVIADFYNSPLIKGERRGYNAYPEMYEQGFFEDLPPVPGALSAVREILTMFPGKVHILTQPVANTYYSYSEKAAWIKKWFPELKDNVIMTQNKEFIAGQGRVLIDDNKTKWKDSWETRGGSFVHFDDTKDSRSQWAEVITWLKVLEIQTTRR